MSTVHISPFDDFIGRRSRLREYYHKHSATLTREDRLYVSMADDLLPGDSGVAVYEEDEPYLEVAVGGHLVTAKPSRPRGMGATPGSVGARRGDVTGFSRQSRNRLMRLIASTRKEEKPLFATLTYPDLFPSDASAWKRDLDAFGKRFRRRFDGGAFVWRIEFKSRRSGENEGEIAPHYHLLVWGVDLWSFRDWAPGAWASVVGSDDPRHLKAGTSSERVKTWNGVMSYVSKYMAKVDDMPSDWAGRSWGVIARDKMPWAVVLVLEITNDQAVRLVRLGRKYLGMAGRVLTFGLTWIMDTERVLDYLEVMVGFT